MRTQQLSSFTSPDKPQTAAALVSQQIRQASWSRPTMKRNCQLHIVLASREFHENHIAELKNKYVNRGEIVAVIKMNPKQTDRLANKKPNKQTNKQDYMITRLKLVIIRRKQCNLKLRQPLIKSYAYVSS